MCRRSVVPDRLAESVPAEPSDSGPGRSQRADRRQRVEVRLRAHRPAVDLLGGHVCRCPHEVAGTREPRLDAPGKVTGTAVYAADWALPGMLHGKIARSGEAHARLVRVDTGRALQRPGVRAAITAADVPDVRYGGAVKDETVFAVDLRDLKSNSEQRDMFIKMAVMQTQRYPTAAFVPTRAQGLASPLPANGSATFTLTGQMTVHGVTKEQPGTSAPRARAVT